jgi:hypothetical protein
LRPYRLPRRLGNGSRLSTGSASYLSHMVAHVLRSYRRLLQGGLPFSLQRALTRRLLSLLLSLSFESANLDCQDLRPALPTLSRGTLLYAARTFLCLSAATILLRQPCPTLCRLYYSRFYRPLLSLACSGAGIRTPTLRSKVCCPTVRRPRIARRDSYYNPFGMLSQSCRLAVLRNSALGEANPGGCSPAPPCAWFLGEAHPRPLPCVGGVTFRKRGSARGHP